MSRTRFVSSGYSKARSHLEGLLVAWYETLPQATRLREAHELKNFKLTRSILDEANHLNDMYHKNQQCPDDKQYRDTVSVQGSLEWMVVWSNFPNYTDADLPAVHLCASSSVCMSVDNFVLRTERIV